MLNLNDLDICSKLCRRPYFRKIYISPEFRQDEHHSTHETLPFFTYSDNFFTRSFFWSFQLNGSNKSFGKKIYRKKSTFFWLYLFLVIFVTFNIFFCKINCAPYLRTKNAHKLELIMAKCNSTFQPYLLQMVIQQRWEKDCFSSQQQIMLSVHLKFCLLMPLKEKWLEVQWKSVLSCCFSLIIEKTRKMESFKSPILYGFFLIYSIDTQTTL